jgi:hypothetical protein
MSIADYPLLAPSEFAEACHHLESAYCRAALGPERGRWKLRRCTALSTDFIFDVGYTTFIQIRRPLQTDLDHGDLSLDLDNFSFSDDPKQDDGLVGDSDMVDAEDSDEVTEPHMYFVLLSPFSHKLPGGSREAPIPYRCRGGGIRDSSSPYIPSPMFVVQFTRTAPRRACL